MRIRGGSILWVQVEFPQSVIPGNDEIFRGFIYPVPQYRGQIRLRVGAYPSGCSGLRQVFLVIDIRVFADVESVHLTVHNFRYMHRHEKTDAPFAAEEQVRQATIEQGFGFQGRVQYGLLQFYGANSFFVRGCPFCGAVIHLVELSALFLPDSFD